MHDAKRSELPSKRGQKPITLGLCRAGGELLPEDGAFSLSGAVLCLCQTAAMLGLRPLLRCLPGCCKG